MKQVNLTLVSVQHQARHGPMLSLNSKSTHQQRILYGRSSAPWVITKLCLPANQSCPMDSIRHDLGTWHEPWGLHRDHCGWDAWLPQKQPSKWGANQLKQEKSTRMKDFTGTPFLGNKVMLMFRSYKSYWIIQNLNVTFKFLRKINTCFAQISYRNMEGK